MKSQELTLLQVFDAIMTEGSVTRAGQRLAMSQPAVSNAIARMRDIWKDPVFVKKGRQIEPTAFAQSLWAQVRDPIQQLSSALESRGFDPAQSHRQFRIAIADLSVDLYWLPFSCQVAALAPDVDLYAVPYTRMGVIEQLREARIDIGLGPLSQHDRSLRSIPLYQNTYKLVMRKDHPLAGKAITIDDFLAAKHLLVSQSGDPRGNVDQALQRLEKRRRVAMTVNHFSAVPKLLLNSDLIAVVPQMVAGGPPFNSDLWITEPPLDIEASPVYLVWHTRLDRDLGLIWLRNLLEKVVQEEWAKCSHCAAE
ncbi:LysR family transcriptional regulator [Zhongshania aquimaris]|uniref:LysR family transcriptional regulator n=1 Tax=Zhongshania aquimaris TaxID=2857107 RepID=A0ABS6VU04_9GAMM|nr:LysR family transcriptional regulator [Zhongshania aquimaris]MBW2941807.1 LysR family transcriptional regulator [Zhongshania aquimaris]